MTRTVEECRTCLRKIEEEDVYSLFQYWNTDWALSGALLADDLTKLTDIELNSSTNSKVICSQCYRRLEDACSFIVMVQRSDSILRKRGNNIPTNLETEASWPQPILLNKSMNENVDNTVDIEIKREVLSEDGNGPDEMEMDQDWDPTLDIKIEPEEIVAPDTSTIHCNGTYSVNDINEQVFQQNGTDNCFEDEEYLDNLIKQEPLSEDEQDGLETDLPLDCMLCMKAFHSVTGLKAHVISQHSYGTVKRKTSNCPSPVKKECKEFVCATCRESFRTRTDLMVHETCHSKHVCFVCDAKFKTFRQLSRHSARCRPKKNDSRIKPPSKPKQLSRNNKNLVTEEQNVDCLLTQIKTEPSDEATHEQDHTPDLSSNNDTPIQRKHKPGTEEQIVEPIKNTNEPNISTKVKDELIPTKENEGDTKEVKSTQKHTNAPVIKESHRFSDVKEQTKLIQISKECFDDSEKKCSPIKEKKVIPVKTESDNERSEQNKTVLPSDLRSEVSVEAVVENKSSTDKIKIEPLEDDISSEITNTEDDPKITSSNTETKLNPLQDLLFEDSSHSESTKVDFTEPNSPNSVDNIQNINKSESDVNKHAHLTTIEIECIQSLDTEEQEETTIEETVTKDDKILNLPDDSSEPLDGSTKSLKCINRNMEVHLEINPLDSSLDKLEAAVIANIDNSIASVIKLNSISELSGDNLP